MKKIKLKNIFYAFILSFCLMKKSIGEIPYRSFAFSDRQTAKLTREILTENIPQNDFEKTYFHIQNQGDLHHFSPSFKDIKQLSFKKIFISGPVQLFPWIKTIFQRRNRQKELLSFILEVKDTDIIKYQFEKKDKHALSHFWLYPEIRCSFQNQIYDFLNSHGIQTKKRKSCHNKEWNQIKNEMKFINISPVILTHSALSPLLKSLNITHFNLKGSHHDEHISAHHIKGLINFLKKYPHVLWIEEKNVHIPHQISHYKRKKDQTVKINLQDDHDLKTFLKSLRPQETSLR